MNKSASMRRSNPRKFFDVHKQPPVMAMIKEKVYDGAIVDYSSHGIRLIMQGHTEAAIGDFISKLYLGKPDNNSTIENLPIVHMQRDYADGRLSLGVRVQNADVEHQINESTNSCLRSAEGGEIIENLPHFPGELQYSSDAVKSRRDWLKRNFGAATDSISQSIFSPESLAGNIENYIGSVQVPVGIAGPLMIRGLYAQGFVPVPIATTEGALIASISRGAKACNAAGGVRTHVVHQRMLRAPVFFCADMDGAINLERWVKNNYVRIKKEAESVSSVAELLFLNTSIFGDMLNLQFFFSTGDAAGQNMTTACTFMACEWIVRNIKDDRSIGFVDYIIEGNMAGDKKVNIQNFITGRGINVIASCYVSGEMLGDILKVSVPAYMRQFQTGGIAGRRLGMLGMNVNFANVIAGVFTCSGQDIASVHESSLGIFEASQRGDGILFNAELPSLVIGTIGGGTRLPTQHECLSIMGCHGQGGAFRLAEIIAATCLALDISTSSAVHSHDFVRAHEKFGRNRPASGLTRSGINTIFFTSLLSDPHFSIVSFREELFENKTGIISRMGQGKGSRLNGIFRYCLSIMRDGVGSDLPVVLKLKTDDGALIKAACDMAKLSGDDILPGLFEANSVLFGFHGSAVREIEFYRNAKREMLAFAPKIFGVQRDDRKGIYAILMEDLSSCSMLNAADDSSGWNEETIGCVLDSMAAMHALYFDRAHELQPVMNINEGGGNPTRGMCELLYEMTRYNCDRYPELFGDDLADIFVDFIDSIDANNDMMKAYHRTLTHNDFNPRNICMRRHDDGFDLVVYDWEVPCFQNPQHDLVEFLSYVVDKENSFEKFAACAERYRLKLEEMTGCDLNSDDFYHILYLNALDLGVIRFNLCLLAHNILHFAFMDRVFGRLAVFIHGLRGMIEEREHRQKAVTIGSNLL